MKIKEDVHLREYTDKRDKLPKMELACEFKAMGLLVPLEKVILTSPPTEDK